MARRKEFKTIAEGLLNSFVSRNNDVYGYWGIGKLFNHMVSSGTMQLKIDLVLRKIEPCNDEFKLLINHFSDRLMTQIEKRQIDKAFFKTAKITILGYPNKPRLEFGQMAPHKVYCKLVIVDDLDRAHISKINIWCREHNPTLELKSARNYK